MIQDTVGFIGLGNLGKAIADNIAKGGFEMCVYDVVGADERAPQGAVVGASVSEVAERSGLIFICLPTVESIETVVDEICSANIADGTVVVNNSTAGRRARSRPMADSAKRASRTRTRPFRQHRPVHGPRRQS